MPGFNQDSRNIRTQEQMDPEYIIIDDSDSDSESQQRRSPEFIYISSDEESESSETPNLNWPENKVSRSLLTKQQKSKVAKIGITCSSAKEQLKKLEARQKQLQRSRVQEKERRRRNKVRSKQRSAQQLVNRLSTQLNSLRVY